MAKSKSEFDAAHDRIAEFARRHGMSCWRYKGSITVEKKLDSMFLLRSIDLHYKATIDLEVGEAGAQVDAFLDYLERFLAEQFAPLKKWIDSNKEQ